MIISEHSVVHRPRKIRVLLVTDEMEIGGTQRQIVHIARNLDARRFEPVVAYFRNRSFLVDELDRAGVPTHHIPKGRKIDVGFLIRLTAFLRCERFDVMHCFSFTGELWGTVARCLLASNVRPTLITSIRNTYDWYTAWQWRLKRWVSGQSYRVIANSRRGAEYAQRKMRLGPEAIEIVYNGVAPITPVITDECCNRIRSMLDVLPGDVLGILVGRLVDQKNVPVALRAVKLLETEGKRFRLAIAGDGPLRQRIEEQIEALGLSRTVILLGHLADVERLIAASDILVLPSFREGLSNVILEAMMAGKAVIASDVGGNGELVEHGSTGLLFPSDDDVALAASLRSLIIDGTLRARFGAAARTRARVQFGVPVMIRAMEHHYEKCGEGRDSMRAAL